MPIFYILIFGWASGLCEVKCCSELCLPVCNEDLDSFKCSVLGFPTRSASYQCMQGFLVSETELRLLLNTIKYYSFKEILSQLLIVLKQLPALHADCFLFFQQVFY